jgi:hypothetical protein
LLKRSSFLRRSRSAFAVIGFPDFVRTDRIPILFARAARVSPKVDDRSTPKLDADHQSLDPKMSGATTKHQPVVGGGDDLDDGLELDPTMLADSDVEGGSDDEAPVGGAVLEDEEDAFDLQQDDEEVVDEDGEEDRPQEEGSKKRKAGGESEAELEKKRRKKEKEKERKARVSISAPLHLLQNVLIIF